MLWKPRQATALSLILACAGTVLVPGQGQAQQARGYTDTGVNGVADGVTSPNISVGQGELGVPRDDGSTEEVTGQQRSAAGVNPYAASGNDGWAGADPASVSQARSQVRDQDLVERTARYYGTSRNSEELSSDNVSDADYTADRGKTVLHPKRLGVFDQNHVDQRELVIKPYIEVGQVADAYLSPKHQVLTYSEAAAGLEAYINGRNNQGVVSLRFERNFGESGQGSGNAFSGLARLSSAIIPNTLRVDYGGYANQTYVTPGGATIGTVPVSGDALTQVYSVYAGPALTTHLGDVAVDGHYRLGYTKIGNTPLTVTTPGAPVLAAGDIFDHSTVQDARLSLGTRPGELAPVGLGADAGFYKENASNLAQQIIDKHVRGEVTVPLSGDLAAVGGVGFEDVVVTSHDAVHDANGLPVVDASGHYVTDFAGPRYVAFDTRGLIYDAGVIWRPSRRTNLEVHVGRRYGGFSAYGTLTYQPDSRSAVNIVFYDNLAGFGGDLTNSLFNLPTQFQTVRDAITGNLSSCVSSLSSGTCLAGVLGQTNSAIYRSQGLTATYGVQLGRFQTGVAFGYNRRRYIGSPNTVLASVDGKVDRYVWAAGYVTREIDENSRFEATIDAYRFQSGLTSTGDLTAIRAVALYQRHLSQHLEAHASLALDGISRDNLDDAWSMSGAVSMRYIF